MKSLMQKGKKGFTLVELIVIIAVIAILAAVLVPSFINARENANQTEAELNESLSMLYTNKNGQTLPPEHTGINGSIESLSVTPNTLQVVKNVPDDSLSVKIVTSKGETITDKSLCSWASSDVDKVVVTSDGIVQGIDVTNTPVTITAAVGGKFAICEVTVIADSPTSPRPQSGGKVYYKCYNQSGGKCTQNAGNIEKKADGVYYHICNDVSEITSSKCFINQCKQDIVTNQGLNDASRITIENDYAPIIRLESDYDGDMSFPYAVMDSNGNATKIAVNLDLNGHTINGSLSLNCTSNVTSGIPYIGGEKDYSYSANTETLNKTIEYKDVSGNPVGKGVIKSVNNGINVLGIYDETESVPQSDLRNLRVEAGQNGIVYGGGLVTKNNCGIIDCDIIAGSSSSGILINGGYPSDARIINRNNVYAGIGINYSGSSGQHICGNCVIAEKIGIKTSGGTSPMIENCYVESRNGVGIFVGAGTNNFGMANYVKGKTFGLYHTYGLISLTNSNDSPSYYEGGTVKGVISGIAVASKKFNFKKSVGSIATNGLCRIDDVTASDPTPFKVDSGAEVGMDNTTTLLNTTKYPYIYATYDSSNKIFKRSTVQVAPPIIVKK